MFIWLEQDPTTGACDKADPSPGNDPLAKLLE